MQTKSYYQKVPIQCLGGKAGRPCRHKHCRETTGPAAVTRQKTGIRMVPQGKGSPVLFLPDRLLRPTREGNRKILYTIFAKPQIMGVLTRSDTGGQSADAAATPNPSDFSDRFQAALQRSQQFLLSEQKPQGYWVGELMVDSTLVSDTVAYHHWNGKVDPEWQRKAVNHILSMQLPDGGWNIYYGGPSEVNATIKAYLALKLAGVSVKDPRMLKAREVALHFGGVPRMNTFSKLYLALIGL